MKKIIYIILMIFMFGCFSNKEDTIQFSKQLKDNSNFDISIRHDSAEQVLVSGNISIIENNIDVKFEDIIAVAEENILRFSVKREINNNKIYIIDVVVVDYKDIFRNVTYEVNYYIGKSIIDASLEYLKFQKENTVNFTDKNFEALIREKLNKKSGVILKPELETIIILEGENRNIVDISEITLLENLEKINLNNNKIENISVLENLEKLVEVKIENNNLTTNNINKNIIEKINEDDKDIYYSQYLSTLNLSYLLEEGVLKFTANQLDQFALSMKEEKEIEIFEVFKTDDYSENTPSSKQRLVTETDKSQMYFYAKVGDVKSEIIQISNNVLLIESVEGFEEINLNIIDKEVMLPEKVILVLNNNEKIYADVTWKTELIKFGIVSNYVIKGEINLFGGIQNPENLKAEIKINILSGEGKEIILGEPKIKAVKLGSDYQTTTYSAIDAQLNDISDSVIVIDNVNPNIEGEYEVTYELKGEENTGTIVKQKVIVDGTAPIININKENKNYVKLGEQLDLLVTVKDNFDGNVNLETIGQVDYNKIGNYEIKYIAIDFAGNKSEKTIEIIVDGEKPEITLIGNDYIELEYGNEYIDEGFKGLDNISNNEIDLTDLIKIETNVNYNKIGEYEMKYNLIDYAGYEAEEKIRKILITGMVTKEIKLEEITIKKGTEINDLNILEKIKLPLEDGTEREFIIEWDFSNYDKDKMGVTTIEGKIKFTNDIKSDENISIEIMILDEKAPELTIDIPSKNFIKLNEEYIIPNYSAKDSSGNDITKNIKTEGTVNTSLEGTYEIKYTVEDALGNTNKKLITYYVDGTKPIITLYGENPTLIKMNDLYDEKNAYASDNFDLDTTKVEITGIVDSSKPGEYKIYYNVSDKAGNESEESFRTVIVEELEIIKLVDTLKSIEINYGETPSITDKVNVELENGETKEFNVEWDYSKLEKNKTGNYQINGTIIFDNEYYKNTAGIESEIEINVVDKIKPEINLSSGTETVKTNYSITYIDKDVSAIDGHDGIITNRIIRDSNVNTDKIGYYTIKYNVKDEAGNSAETKERTIIVTGKIVSNEEISERTIRKGESISDLNLPTKNNSSLEDGTKRELEIIWDYSNYDTNKAGTVTLKGKLKYPNDIIDNNEEISVKINILGDEAPVLIIDLVSPTYIKLNASYIPATYSAKDSLGRDITASIKINGNVDTKKEGTYSVKYSVEDSIGNTNEKILTYYVDGTKPVIKLNGAITMTVKYLDSFIDPLASASDNFVIDSKDILISGNVNINLPGTYKLYYNITDKAGNNANQVERTVIVDKLKVISVQGFTKETINYGSSLPSLPSSLEVTLENNLKRTFGITWDTSIVNLNVVKDYTISGNLNYDSKYYLNTSGYRASLMLNVVDKVKPIIKIKPGTEKIEIYCKSNYIDEDVMAYDEYDGDITDEMIPEKRLIDTSMAKTVVYNYYVIDSSNNRSENINNQRRIDVKQLEMLEVGDIIGKTINYGENLSQLPSKVLVKLSDNREEEFTISWDTSKFNKNVLGKQTISGTLDYSIYVYRNEKQLKSEIEINVVDKVKPEISVKSTRQEIYLNSSYEEDTTAYDAYDKDLTAKIKVTGAVNTGIVGEYKLIYNVTDNSGNKADSKTKTVIVKKLNIKSVSSFTTNTIEYKKGRPSIPTTGEITLSDNSKTTCNISWDFSNFTSSTIGQYTYFGTLIYNTNYYENLDNIKAKVIINVIETKINAISGHSISVYYGTPSSDISFPSTVRVYLSNGDNSQYLNVNWDRSTYNETELKTQTIKGTFSKVYGIDTSSKIPSVSVNVIDFDLNINVSKSIIKSDNIDSSIITAKAINKSGQDITSAINEISFQYRKGSTGSFINLSNNTFKTFSPETYQVRAVYKGKYSVEKTITVKPIVMSVTLTVYDGPIYSFNKSEKVDYKIIAKYNDNKSEVVIDTRNSTSQISFNLHVNNEIQSEKKYFYPASQGIGNYYLYAEVDGKTSMIVQVTYKNSITFSSENYEFAVRNAIPKSDGYIYQEDLLKIKEISFNEVSNFSGINLLKNVEKLTIKNPSMGYISGGFGELASLSKLNNLYLDDVKVHEGNLMNDISKISSLRTLSIIRGDLIYERGLPEFLQVENLVINYNSKSLSSSFFKYYFKNAINVDLRYCNLNYIDAFNKDTIKKIDLRNNNLNQDSLRAIYEYEFNEFNEVEVSYDKIMITEFKDTTTLARDLGVTLPFDSSIIKKRNSIKYSSDGPISTFEDLYYLPNLTEIDTGYRFFGSSSTEAGLLPYLNLDVLKGKNLKTSLPSYIRTKLEANGVTIIDN